MGHKELGRLPRLRGWKTVIALLDCQSSSTEDLARRILNEAEHEIDLTRKGEAVGSLFWKLTRLLATVGKQGLAEALQESGLPASSGKSVFALAQALRESCAAETQSLTSTNPALAALLEQATSTTVLRLVTPHVASIFGAGEAELEHALKKVSSKTGYGLIARTLMSEYLSGVLTYIASRHSPEQADAPDFGSALKNWSWETSALVERFSADWYSKHNWLSGSKIPRKEVDAYIAYAFSKLKSELHLSKPNTEESQ